MALVTRFGMVQFNPSAVIRKAGFPQRDPGPTPQPGLPTQADYLKALLDVNGIPSDRYILSKRNPVTKLLAPNDGLYLMGVSDSLNSVKALEAASAKALSLSKPIVINPVTLVDETA